MDKTETPVPAFTVSDVNKAIDTMVKAQARSAGAIGKVLVMAVYASIVGIEKDHVGVANAVTKNLRKSTKQSAVIAFLEQYGQLAYLGEKKGWQHFALGTQKDLAWTKDYVETVQKAAETWESFKPEAEETEFDVEAKIRKIIADAAKRQKNGKPVKAADILADLPAVLAKHTALVG